jgi:hypothetical protein
MPKIVMGILIVAGVAWIIYRHILHQQIGGGF